MDIWKDVEGYEGLYQVSNFGRVRSLGNGKSNNSKNKILKQEKIRNGYLRVKLCKNGKHKRYLVHRLVAEAFIPNWFDDPCVNHIDENKTNNHIDNLEWCDAKYNNNYGTHNERISKKLTNNNRSKPVLQYTLFGNLVKEWPSTKEAERNGYNHSNICNCCNGKLKHYKGYIWRYK